MDFRSASICLFGHLNKACHGNCEDIFLEQVIGGLVPLLLHLQDPQASVAGVSSQRGGWATQVGPRDLASWGLSVNPAGLQVCPAHVRPQPGA